MRPDEHERMFRFEDHYWWFVGRQAILTAILNRHLQPADQRRILDLGCGSGATLKRLEPYGEVYGLEPSIHALRLCRSRGLRRLVSADATQLPFVDAAFDLVTAFDTIEHIADEAAALGEIRRVLTPGGQLLLTVPAYQFLWSEHDEALDHYRRYTARQMGARLTEAGLAIERLSYCITFLLPAATALRVGQRLLPHPPREPRCALIELPPLLNRLCLWTLQVEAKLLPYLNLPCGVSVLALARKG